MKLGFYMITVSVFFHSSTCDLLTGCCDLWSSHRQRLPVDFVPGSRCPRKVDRGRVQPSRIRCTCCRSTWMRSGGGASGEVGRWADEADRRPGYLHTI
jgi:hypothetical protein